MKLAQVRHGYFVCGDFIVALSIMCELELKVVAGHRFFFLDSLVVLFEGALRSTRPRLGAQSYATGIS